MTCSLNLYLLSFAFIILITRLAIFIVCLRLNNVITKLYSRVKTWNNWKGTKFQSAQIFSMKLIIRFSCETKYLFYYLPWYQAYATMLHTLTQREWVSERERKRKTKKKWEAYYGSFFIDLWTNKIIYIPESFQEVNHFNLISPNLICICWTVMVLVYKQI